MAPLALEGHLRAARENLGLLVSSSGGGLFGERPTTLTGVWGVFVLRGRLLLSLISPILCLVATDAYNARISPRAKPFTEDATGP